MNVQRARDRDSAICILTPGDETALYLPANHVMTACCFEQALLEETLHEVGRTTSLETIVPNTAFLALPPDAVEIATRSSIGMYFFSPPGENERLIKQSELKQIEARDTTDSAALLSKRWHDAREKRKAALVASEGEANFAGVQRFLECVHTFAAERRLLRFLYTAIK